MTDSRQGRGEIESVYILFIPEEVLTSMILSLRFMKYFHNYDLK